MNAPYFGTHPAGKALTGFFATALRSRVVVATAIATVAALTAAAAITIDSRYLAQGAGTAFWPRNAIDDYAFASTAAQRVGAIAQGRPTMVLVGTAAMREGLLPAGDIEHRLRQRLGREMPVVNLSTGGQSPLEAAGLIFEAAPQAKGTLVLAVSPSRMSASGGELQKLLDHPRLAFMNDGIRREAEALGLKVPAQRGVYLLDNLQFYVVRAPSFVANLLTGTKPVNDEQTYLGRGHQDAEEWDKDTRILAQRLSGYDRNFTANIAPYRRIVRWIKDNHLPWNVVLLEIPLNPRALAEATGPDFYPAHIANMRKFCAEEGCTYVNSNPRKLLAEEHFFDWSHLSSQRGKEIFTDAFLDDIAETL
ncbi:hypothetical protein [Magnetospirillum aberrantis]|uniref:Uncharacterized protein n=1 Tax=Magnetospirillum aberrantis SpK TaxID=908842 RepID=A0A7C9UYU2_9PROT|nr:hypothetical protein [Magnetospirillum aberrantis]NFV82269.1 hypothetical protein [Magnetospirillum aberrantis SpK]